MIKIITIHGIRKDIDWDKDFKGLSIWQNSGVEILNFEYGFFSIWKFLWPFSRKRVYREFQKFYSHHISTNEPPPSLICHSFGTKIFFYTIKKYQVIKFDKVILCGSILNTKTRFDDYFEKKQISKLINDFGCEDGVVKFSHLVMKDCGKSGQKGFKYVSEIYRDRLIQRENYFDHSDYFLHIHMSENWASFLMPEKKIKYNKRILRDDVIERIYKNIKYENIEYTRITYSARIDDGGNYYAKYDKTGLNKTGNSMSSYEIVATADALVAIDDMHFSAESAGKRLMVTNNDDFNQNKSFIVHFEQLVNNNQDFNIVYKFEWRETLYQKSGDTDHFLIRNARNITIQINFKTRLKSPRFFIVKEKKIISEQKADISTELDGTHNYMLQYSNDENSDGIIFYFEGNDTQQQKNMPRVLKNVKCKLNSQNFEICKCNNDDIREIIAIENDIEYTQAASEETLRKRLSMFSDGFLVAKINNKVVGYIESLIWDGKKFEAFEEIKNFPLHFNPNGSELYIIFLAVSEPNRKNGIATELLAKVESISKKYKFSKISLVAKDDLTRFYGKLGFNQVRELPNFLPGKTYKSVLMEKYLSE